MKNAVPVGSTEDVLPYQPRLDNDPDIEDPTDADNQGPDETWKLWSSEIQAAFKAEKVWRSEAVDAEKAYHGDPNLNHMSKDASSTRAQTNMVHANVEVLKPLVYSDRPEALVRRRFHGDGELDDTDRLAAEVAQRIGSFLIDTTDFDNVMELSRDDWLISGRGTPRVLYKPEYQQGEDGVRVKVGEEVVFRHPNWRRCLFAPANTWHELRWIAFENLMTKTQVQKRFGHEIAGNLSYNIDGLRDRTIDDQSEDLYTDTKEKVETGAPSKSTFNQVVVWEIWDREAKKVRWWCPNYSAGLLDEKDDPYQLKNFFNVPRPLLANTINGSLIPRPDIAYYKDRADEVDIATKKLTSILNAIAVVGFYPGTEKTMVKKALHGENAMLAVEEWMSFAERGGAQGIIEWLPLDQFIKCAQALIVLRDQSKMAMYEVSGVSDIMRGQGDPTETATAQQIKGRYSGLRLGSKQKRMAFLALDTLAIGIELVVKHFDTKTIAEMVNIDLAPTPQIREMMKAQGVPIVDNTSWQEVHDRLRNDMTRLFSIDIDTDSTVMVDQQADKEARVEFLTSFATFLEVAMPLTGAGFDMKTVKELLMFGIRGFHKARTLEGYIRSLPDEMPEQKEDVEVTVAKIKAETDLMVAQLREGGASERDAAKHSASMREMGAQMQADAAMARAELTTEQA